MTLLLKIQEFLRVSGMPVTKFGRLSVNDPRLVGDLRRGRTPGPAMIARIETYIASHEPRA